MSKLKDVLDFLELDEGFERRDILEGHLDSIDLIKGHSADEISLVAYKPDSEVDLGTLQEFSEALQDKVIEGVCNVIRSFIKG